MAEKGLLINTQAGGKSLALRDAIAADELSNPRLIQLVDAGGCPGKKMSSPMGSPMRVGVTGDDPYDLSLMPADFYTSLLDCGDASYLIVTAEFAGIGNSQRINAWVVIFDTLGTTAAHVFGLSLETRWLLVDNAGQITRDTAGTSMLSNRVIIPIGGAPRIGLFMKSTIITSTADVWGYLV